MPAAQKTPTAPSLNDIAAGRSTDRVFRQGRAWPCSVTAVSGPIVTVKFEVTGPWTLPTVTIPIAEPQYLRFPIQVGDTGLAVPGDCYIGNITGLGTTKPKTPKPQNPKHYNIIIE